METIKISDLWNDYRLNNDVEKTSEIILDILTSGICAGWDSEKIDRFKKQLINRYEL
jgi:hypothetical protein